MQKPLDSTRRAWRRPKLLLLTGALSALLPLPNCAQATETFSASFETGFDADVSAGSARAHSRNLGIVHGKAGNGIQFGKADQFLSYEVKGNLDLMRGTVAMWVKPVGFSPHDVPDVAFDLFDLFRVSAGGDEIRLCIVRHGETDKNTNRIVQIQTAPVRPDGSGGGGARVRAYGWIHRHLQSRAVEWPAEQFKHVAATWDFGVGVLEVYLDGRRAAITREDSLRKRWSAAPERFEIGPANGVRYPGGQGSETKNVVLDEVKVFDRRLSSEEIAQLAGQTDGAYDRRTDYALPLITAPEIHEAPTIDGTATQGEWDGASATGGFVNIGNHRDSGCLASDDVEVRVAHDAARLYVLFGTPLANMPSPYTGGPDHYDRDLDMIEFWGAPHGPKGDVFQFIGAPNGATLDTKNGDSQWNGKWAFGNSFDDGRWTAELSIAFAELGVATPKPGDEWRANFCRFYPQDRRATCWSDTVVRYDAPERLGRLRFGEEATGAVVEVSRMLAGELGWRCGAANGSAAPMAVEVDVQSRLKPVYVTDGGAGDGMTTPTSGDLFHKVQTWKLASGQSRETTIRDSFQERGSRFYSVSAFRLPERTPVLQQLLPIPTSARQKLSVTAHVLYESRQVLAEVELGSLRQQVKGEIEIAAKLHRDGKDVAITHAPRVGSYTTVGLPPKPWQPGDYRLLVEALVRRTPVATASTTVRVEAQPDWWGNNLGMAVKVQPPWTPVQSHGDGVSVWGREYRFGASGLPIQMSTQDVELLAGPVSLRLGADERSVAETTISPSVMEDARAVHTVTGRLGPYEVKGSLETTYDGVVEYDYCLTPTDPEAQISGLCLEFPFRRDLAKYLARRAPTNDPKDGRPFRMDRSQRLPFSHSLWVGDIDHGLNWYTDTDEGWTAPREEAVEIEVLPDRTVLRLHVLAPGPASELELRFGLLATPFRPLPDDWRTIRFSGMRGDFPEYWTEANLMKYETGKAFLYGRSPLDRNPNGTFVLPAKERDWLDTHLKWVREQGAKFILYSPGHGTTARSHAYQTYRAEWDMLPRRSMDPGRVTHFFYVCPKSRHPDYLLWNLDRMIKAGKLDGVYFDQATADECKNALHGCGYQQGAVRRPTYTVRAQREFYRRVRQLLLDNGLDPIIVGHTSNQVIPANYTHLDVLYNGEQFHSSFPNNDYIDAIDEDMLHVQWSSKLMGLPVVFLPEILWHELKRNRWNSKELWETHMQGEVALRATRKLMALLLPNDMLYGGSLMHIPTGQRVWRMWDTLDGATYYSHNDAALSTEPGPPRIQTGLYVKSDGDALLVAGNLDEERADVAIRVERGTLDLADVRARDPFDDKPCEVTEQTVRLRVDGKDFRLVMLEKR